MPKSLAEMRQSKVAGLPERWLPLCLAQSLVAETLKLQSERADLVVASAAPPDDDGNATSARPKRAAQKTTDPRVADIDARLKELGDEMREHTGDLRLRGVTGGEWRRWVDSHPPREDNTADVQIAYGFCNGDALLDDLETYVVSWNDDPLGEGDWEFIANRAAPGDLKELCRVVVQMHEGPGATAAGKSPSSTSPTPTSETE